MKSVLALLVVLLSLSGCGGGSDSSGPSPVPTPTPAPALNVSVSLVGGIELHPSANPTFLYALRYGIRVQETNGGSGTWNFVRLTLLRSGRGGERAEIGANTISSAGFSEITARQDRNIAMTFRANSTDFDSSALSFGFTDRRNGQTVIAEIPSGRYEVDLLPEPAPCAGDGASRLGQKPEGGSPPVRR